MKTYQDIKLAFRQLLLLVFFLFVSNAYAQDIQYEEQELKALFNNLFLNDGTKFYQPDSVKLDLCKEISGKLYTILLDYKSFSYPFDSLNRLGIRTSQDRKVRVYTWSIKLEGAGHRYFGFIQKKERKKIQLFPLNERIYKTDTVKYFNLTNDNWFGVNYYQIIDFKRKSKKYYLLIGMRNNGYTSKSKVLEVLSFSRKKAKFGKMVFKSDDRKIRRVLFEYSNRISMLLHYDEQYKMVVFDHLSPDNSSLKGLYRFYGPDGSYDAYKYDGNKWVYKPEVWVVEKKDKPKRVTKKYGGNIIYPMKK